MSRFAEIVPIVPGRVYDLVWIDCGTICVHINHPYIDEFVYGVVGTSYWLAVIHGPRNQFRTYVHSAGYFNFNRESRSDLDPHLVRWSVLGLPGTIGYTLETDEWIPDTFQRVTVLSQYTIDRTSLSHINLYTGDQHVAIHSLHSIPPRFHSWNPDVALVAKHLYEEARVHYRMVRVLNDPAHPCIYQPECLDRVMYPTFYKPDHIVYQSMVRTRQVFHRGKLHTFKRVRSGDCVSDGIPFHVEGVDIFDSLYRLMGALPIAYLRLVHTYT